MRCLMSLLLVVGLGGLAMVKPAQATPESQAAVLLLLIEPGARAIGMGETYVAIADDGEPDCGVLVYANRAYATAEPVAA